MKPTEWFQPNNLRQTVLTLLASAIVFFSGVFWKGIYPILQKAVADIPKEVLLVGIILLLLVMALVVGLLIVAIIENRGLQEKPRFITTLGARWKYDPITRTYEDHPYCLCCSPPRPCRTYGTHAEHKVEILTCSTKSPAWDTNFCLHDNDNNWLTIKDAVKRLPQQQRRIT